MYNDDISKVYEHLKHCHIDYLDEITDELLKFEMLKINEPYENIENHFSYSNKISKLNTKIYKIKEIKRIENLLLECDPIMISSNIN